MTDMQVWTLIVGTLTVQVAIVAAMLTLQTRWIKAEFGRLNDKVDRLDRDVHTLISRFMDHLDGHS
jgi:hypothetical protein